jgi:glucosamine--fructose-6-phosphate aminotransferase (isomerizing)
MCSIAGYVGSREAAPILWGALRRLQYRGFDVAELALKDGGPATMVRCRGGVAELEEHVHDAQVAGNVGIAHMRCARPCALDRRSRASRGDAPAIPQGLSAPHGPLCKVGPISLVYDGIVENHQALRGRLLEAGCTFSTDADTELLGHLIHQSLATSARDLAEAVWIGLRQLEGTYAIAVVSDVHGERIVVARSGAPLVVGLGWGEAFVASEESAIHELVSEVIVPDEGEVMDLTLAGATRNRRLRRPLVAAIAEDAREKPAVVG